MDRTIKLSGNLPKEASVALEYLQLWGRDFYDSVSIYPEGIGNSSGLNLIAYFENTETQSKYVIGAIWDAEKKTYSFHS